MNHLLYFLSRATNTKWHFAYHVAHYSAFVAMLLFEIRSTSKIDLRQKCIFLLAAVLSSLNFNANFPLKSTILLCNSVGIALQWNMHRKKHLETSTSSKSQERTASQLHFSAKCTHKFAVHKCNGLIGVSFLVAIISLWYIQRLET